MKNLWILLLVFALSFGFTACSTTDSDSASANSEITDEIEAAEDDDEFAEEDAEEDDEFSDDEFAQEDFDEDSEEEGFDESDEGDEFAEEDAEEGFDDSEEGDEEELAGDDFEEDSDGEFEEEGEEVAFEEESDEDASDEFVADSEETTDESVEEVASTDEELVYPENDPSAGEVAQDGAKVTGLDFLSNQNGGTIMISTNSPVEFSQRKNLGTGQYIVEIDNINLPKRFQRPYDTREFGGAIGLFQAYQEPGSSKARFVIQLNGDVEPLISKEGNAIMVLASTKKELPNQQMLAEGEAASTNNATDEEIASQTVDLQAVRNDKKILGEKSIEDFLIGNTNYYGKKINIELVDTDILRVFDIIAEQSNLNIVVSEDVKGKITLKLRDIPWDQALMVVLQSKQLGYVKSGNILRIAPLKKIEQESREARKVIEAQMKLQPLKVRIFPISYAVADDVVGQVQDFLTEGRGKVKADKRTNSVVVTDVPEVLEKVDKLVKALDTETPQVLMEAKFVEASEDFTKDINLNINNSSRTSDANNQVNFIGSDPSATSGGTDFNAGFFLTFNSVFSVGSLTAKLDLYEKKNLARVISSPRVVGLNNEEAKITQVNQVLDKSKVAEGTDGATTITVTFVPKDVKTELSIKPQITAEGSILMDIQVQRDVAGAQESDEGVTARPISTRSAKTKVLVPNGDTVVIGGVYTFDNSKIKTRMPYLSDVPILGTLFKDERSGYTKSELMIFVTPRVLNIDKAFNKGTILSGGDKDKNTF